MRGEFTREEIISQPSAWRDALEVVARVRPAVEAIFRADFDQVIFTGCGSTYYLSLAGAAFFQKATGKMARAVPAGEFLLYPDAAVGQIGRRRSLLIAVSRSGSTTETIRAVEQFKSWNCGSVIAITNYGDQPLARMADVALVIEKGQESSVAQTRSFAAMYVAAAAVSLLAGGHSDEYKAMQHLPAAGEKLIKSYDELAKMYGERMDIDRVYFLGSGHLYGLACEANLKMKEMTLTHSEPFHFLEFRHGPMSMIKETALIVGLVSEQNLSHEIAVLDEMRELGGHVLALGENKLDVNFGSGLPELCRGILYLPVLQLMAYYRSMAKGLDPDRPANLTAVVTLSL